MCTFLKYTRSSTLFYSKALPCSAVPKYPHYSNSCPCHAPDISLVDVVHHYYNCLSSTLKSLASLKTWSVSSAHSAPWYTLKLQQMKSMGLHLERLSKQTKYSVYKRLNSGHILLYKNTISDTKTSYNQESSVQEKETPGLFFPL